MDNRSKILRDHYTETFKKHGPNSLGLDWGVHTNRVELRFMQMTKLLKERQNFSILDIGCGYGAYCEFLEAQNFKNYQYTGIDLVEEMITCAASNLPKSNFIIEDFLKLDDSLRFDYIICNGIFTQKLLISDNDMLEYLHLFLRKMHKMSTKGFCFNAMSKHANFYAPNLFYLLPSDLINWVSENLTRSIILNQSYGLFEFTFYAYKEELVYV
jgi:SAM-dependent methyltransferase